MAHLGADVLLRKQMKDSCSAIPPRCSHSTSHCGQRTPTREARSRAEVTSRGSRRGRQPHASRFLGVHRVTIERNFSSAFRMDFVCLYGRIIRLDLGLNNTMTKFDSNNSRRWRWMPGKGSCRLNGRKACVMDAT